MNTYQKMGVINLTPDSFCDGRSDLKSSDIQKQILSHLKWADILDFGAQSTAPFNQKISCKDEMERFETLLFPVFKEMGKSLKSISIDTYYPEVFKFVCSYLQKKSAETIFIFNDISSLLDESVCEALSLNPKSSYILTHCKVGSRQSVLDHMESPCALEGEAFLEQMIEDLRAKLKEASGLKNQILIDPGFGFSKTRAQNHYLLKNIDKFASAFSDHTIVLGISRKSFMRFPYDMDAKNLENQNKLDALAALVMNEINKKVNGSIIYRVHNNSSFELMDLAARLV